MRWDETSPVHRPERVSPWKIEPALTHAPDHLPVSQMKRPRASISSSTNSSQHATEGMARITCGEILFPWEILFPMLLRLVASGDTNR